MGDQGQHQAGLPEPIKKRSVASCFIFRVPRDGKGKPAVALFRRSEKVRTYRHHLAPIAGSIDNEDKSPLDTAWRELQEETSLTPSSLELWRKGKPYTFSDAAIGREWTIHPFAFRLKEPDEGGLGEEGIQTDWEHEEWQWFDPDTVSDNESFGAVPRLRDSLRRVWYEGEMPEHASKALTTGLSHLHTHQDGSRELTALALTAFRDVVTQTRDGIDEHWWELIRMAVWHLWKNGRESMGISTINALVGVLADMNDILGQNIGAEQKWDRMLAMADLHLANRKCIPARIRDSFVSYIQSHFLAGSEPRSKLTILTVSASSTIRDSILDAYASLEGIEELELRILESRPLFEGVSIASSLLSKFQSQFQDSPNKRLKMTIYTDASAALAAADVDIVLFGADRISPAKGVCNKTGSLPAVLGARHAAPKAKVLVLSELEKVEGECCGVQEENAFEENDPIEVLSGWHNDGVKGISILEDEINRTKSGKCETSKVEVKNIYFEWVPLSLVDAFVSEEGVLDEQKIRDKSQEVGANLERYLGGL
ncbi:hypothetical protein ASPWEDRAFT_119953 [Aspergillus wentii DTO 134E9]|uniref:Nudix hydrolase domain-containing protein n=1 Tax=Aspergillus wentii DTO 134E9 TaxID=1073089 RepID=A0A1L9R9N2_ASPWE|nr:uncharacterized protein ASPWEDRAFT_119953 [Aspergillus wentii DTO 134E9]OJJ31609.1 hypothetical protein ASPWEDRAFT_119953 [Aspergillus wentii DTO 134E9]